MRYLKILVIGLLLVAPVLATADAEGVPESALWYFHVDLEQMRDGGPGEAVYDWLREEVFAEVKEDAGLDLEKELDRVTSYSSGEDSGVLIIEGNISQATKDKVMAFIASGDDITPLKASGKTYFHFGGDENLPEDVTYDAGNIAFQLDSLSEESWISMDVKNKLIITATESHMEKLLANKGRIPGSRKGKGALMVLTAEKTLLQAGMNSAALGADGDLGWDSNILRNTEQVAFLMAAAADKLALEARLVTAEPEMAESLASVARGLVSLMAFNDDMDSETVAILQGTKVETSGNSLSVSLAIDPDLVVRTLSD